jgi:DNA polymerase-3 subunit alpha
MDNILAETYGIMVYQEQVMRIFNQLGGIPLAKAYKIIKAISKKQMDVIAAEKQNFVTGAEKNGIKKEQAAEIFALIEEFGKYGFNKSHSTRYAIVAYQTAYLKTYFPLEYMAALLTYEMIDQAKTTEYIEDCRFLVRPDGRTGIPILPPDINQSVADFGVVDGTIRFGLAGVKGVGQKAVESIMAARGDRSAGTHKAFTSVFDFCERVDLRTVNKSVIESLIKCGAFDALHQNRAAATAAIEAAMQSGSSAQNARRAGQESLFGGGASTAMAAAAGEYKLPTVPEWPQGQKMAHEKSVLGFYVTSHPLRDYETMLHDFTTVNTQSIKTASDGKEGILGGLISKVESRIVRSGPSAGQKWATLILEDLSSNVKVTMFAGEFQKYGDLIKPDSVIFFRGKVDRTREEPGFRVYEAFTPEQAVQKLAREVLICVQAEAVDADSIERLSEVIKQNPGRLPAKIQIAVPESDMPLKATLNLCKAVSGSAEALKHLEASIQGATVRLLGPGTYLNAARAQQPQLQPA